MAEFLLENAPNKAAVLRQALARYLKEQMKVELLRLAVDPVDS